MRTANWAALCVAAALTAGCQAAPRTGSAAPSPSDTPATSAPASLATGPLASPLASGPVEPPLATGPLASPPASVVATAQASAASGATTESSYRGPRSIAFPTPRHGVLLALDCTSVPGPCQVFTDVSDDGGATWTAPAVLAAALWPSQDPPWNTLGPNNLVFSNAEDGYAYGPDLYQTRDGGRSWQQLAVTGQVATAAAIGADLWLVVWHGCSDYGCTGWELDIVDAQGRVERAPTQPLAISPPPGVTKVGVPTTLIRPAASTAYLIGFDSLQVSHDGGASWARATFPCNSSYDDSVDFSAGSVAMLWAVCASESGAGMQQKQLWRSTNSGASWQGPLPLESDGYSAQITAINTDVAWRYGDRGNVLHTVDGGRTWQVMLPDLFNQAYGPPTAFAALDHDAWIFDPYGPYDTDARHLYVTNDAGGNWRTITFRTLSPRASP
jgi:photosystem II stability/assembly factor-like uncharacterized protein